MRTLLHRADLRRAGVASVDNERRNVGAEMLLTQVRAGVEDRNCRLVSILELSLGRRELTERVDIKLGQDQVGGKPVLRVLEGEEHDEGEDLDQHDGGATVHEESGKGIKEVRGAFVPDQQGVVERRLGIRTI
jgi:hypothetical protein